jgi:hypothetical protein
LHRCQHLRRCSLDAGIQGDLADHNIPRVGVHQRDWTTRLPQRDFSTQAQSTLNDFEQDLRDGFVQLKPLTDQAFARARQVSQQTTPQPGTRAADLLHVAAALELGAATFLSFDLQQRKLAQAMKLKLNRVPY